MRNRKLKTYTAVSGGSDENPHMRFGVGRNWNFGNFQEEVIALRDLLNDTIEGPAFDRLPKHASSEVSAPVESDTGSGFTLKDLAGMDQASIAALVKALGNGGTEKMPNKTKTRKGATAAFSRGQSVRVRGDRNAFTVSAVRDGEVQVRRTDGVGNRRWYSVGRVTAS
jgi:hypothetical protein